MLLIMFRRKTSEATIYKKKSVVFIFSLNYSEGHLQIVDVIDMKHIRLSPVFVPLIHAGFV